MPNLIGKSLGRYHILQQLGEGGMAVVYKAYDTRLERDVAIKIIRRGAFPPEQLERILKRFEREAKALARLSHTNIVKVHDYGEYEGAPYLVMEYLPGGTLKEKMGKPIPWQAAADLLIPVARALDYAHQRGILHRDVKPSNILLTETGEPMLTDFGIAKILDIEETHTLTGTGVGIGTPEYMAPEQGIGEGVDARADIYSLGIVFYELITGRKPYTADTPMAVIIKQINEPLPSARQFASDLPDGVEKVLLKAVAKSPENRYPDMGAFAAALESLSAFSIPETNLRPTEETTRDTLEPLTDGIDNSLLPAQKKKTWWPWAAGLGGFLIVVCVVIAALRIPKFIATPAPSYTLIPTLTRTLSPTSTDTPVLAVTPSATSIPPLGIGSTWTRPSDGMVMVYVPEGAFTIGDTNEQAMTECQRFAGDCKQKYFVDEQPPHIVILDAYWIDKTEVSNAMYIKCVNSGKCQAPSSSSSKTRSSYYGNPEYDNYPVIYVNWGNANDYCAWAGGRLPSEAEWEKAARGTDERTFPWGNNGPDATLANFKAVDTVAVGSYPAGASPYGALDMAGNVWNWVDDWYDAYPGGDKNASSFFGTTWRVARGGTWASAGATSLRSTYRGSDYPVVANANRGFRCAEDFDH
jgi:eukaryotic-like serine/threonine-protein kinase